MEREKCVKINEEEDRLSQLPVSLLGLILSFLPLKEAAATSILSKFWTRIWLSSDILDFDAFKVFKHHTDMLRLHPQHTLEHAQWITRVLRRHREAGHELKKLRIRMRLHDAFQRVLYGWISYASRCRVQSLELDFTRTINCKPTYAVVRMCVLSAEFAAETDLSCLRSLSLAAVHVTGETIKSFLLKCPLLESLKVCSSPQLLGHLEICGPNLALKHLEISYCRCPFLIVRDTSLVSLTVTWITNLVLSNNPKLVAIRCDRMSDAYGYLQQLEVLACMTSFLDQVPPLTKMKQLTISVESLREDSLICIANLLYRAPKKLEKLALEFVYVGKKWVPSDKKKGNYINCQYLVSREFPRVEVLEVRGYYGELKDDETLRYIFERFEVPLKKIVFDIHNLNRDMYPATTFPPVERSGDERVERLKRVVPSSVEFTVT